MKEMTLEEEQAFRERCKQTNTGKFDNGVTVYTCPRCGKNFAISYIEGWVYKRRTRSYRKNESVLYFCSYSCCRDFDKVFKK